MAMAGNLVINFGDIGVQALGIGSGEGKAPRIEPVTAERVGQRVSVERGERVGIRSWSPRTGAGRGATRVQFCQIVLRDGVRAGTVGKRSSAAKSNNISVDIHILQVAISEGLRRYGLEYLLVFAGPLSLVVHEEKKFIALYGADQTTP